MSYGVFAGFYDQLTKNVNYFGYAKRANALIKSYSPDAKCIAEIACGTLNLGLELNKLGYGVIGVDISQNMLDVAAEKAALLGADIPLLRQDMRFLDLGTKVDAAVCSLDALNHLDSFSDVGAAFLSVRSQLKRGGVYIFDMNTPYKHRRVLGCNTFVYETPEVYTVWQNEFRESDCSVGITLDFFVKSDGDYTRHTERFREIAYGHGAIVAALRASGFELLGVFDELKNASPTARTERILYIARRI